MSLLPPRPKLSDKEKFAGIYRIITRAISQYEIPDADLDEDEIGKRVSHADWCALQAYFRNSGARAAVKDIQAAMFNRGCWSPEED